MSTAATAATNSKEAKQPGVRHVIDNMVYPDYIRNHPVFAKQNKICKVFPGLGLPNVEEECTYSNLEQARSDATNLIYTDMRNALYRALDLYGLHQDIRTLCNEAYKVLIEHPNMIIEEEGKFTLRLHKDVGTWEGKVFWRAGEGLFKAYNKLAELYKVHTKHTMTALETMPYFKAFSTSNVPSSKKFKVVFSSADKEGLWDIATISMRGISSCQTWGSTQSRGLIGSMSSRYVGVIYLTTGDKFNEYGSKMMRRAMVRFCINKNTKKPALLMDRIYPGDDASARKIFKDFLHKKTNLPVLHPNDAEWSQYQLPADSSWKIAPFQTNEYTYMDNKIPYMKPAQTVPKDYNVYYDTIARTDSAMLNKVHAGIMKLLDEYSADKKTHRDIFKGGTANLIVSIKKHYGGANFASSPFMPNLYYYATNGINFPRPDQFESIRDYEKAIIRQAFVQLKTLEEHSLQKIRRSKLAKHYPNSVVKFTKLLISEYKKELAAIYKGLL